MLCAEVTEREEMFVGLGAVVTIGVRNQELSQGPYRLAELPAIGQEPFLDVPLECVEVVGRSLLERMIERFVAIGLERVSILVEAKAFQRIPKFRTGLRKCHVKVVRDSTPASPRNWRIIRRTESGTPSLVRRMPTRKPISLECSVFIGRLGKPPPAPLIRRAP